MARYGKHHFVASKEFDNQELLRLQTPVSMLKVIIVGGGLAGLVSAIAIRRSGHEVIVLERSSEFREVGHATIWTVS